MKMSRFLISTLVLFPILMLIFGLFMGTFDLNQSIKILIGLLASTLIFALGMYLIFKPKSRL
ncbi:hypothetical protein CRG49_005320 [Neisseria sp. N95_16]|nr:hypothetical protein CRG49_005320 [Neisseria sp. N95_16]